MTGRAKGEKLDELGRRLLWAGGRIRYREDGTRVFYIRRKIKNRPFEVALPAGVSEPQAVEHYNRFLRDPEGFTVFSTGTDDRPPLFLDNTLLDNYLAYCRQPQGNRPANSGEWLTRKRNHLRWWAERLVTAKGKALDLRKVPRDLIDVHLDGGTLLGKPIAPAKCRAHRIRVIKAFYSYLLAKQKITRAEDATDGLVAPQANAAQTRGVVKVVAQPQDIEAVIAEVGGHWADALVLQAITGCHVTEVRRFAGNGRVDQLSVQQAEEGYAATLVFLHKNGGEHRVKVPPRGLEAAKRLLEHGLFSRRRYDRKVRDACLKLGVQVFTPANLRHTLATWAVQAGAPMEAVSSFLGHKSLATTKKFYATFAVSTAVPNPLTSPHKKQAPEASEQLAVLQAQNAQLVEQVAQLMAMLAQSMGVKSVPPVDPRPPLHS